MNPFNKRHIVITCIFLLMAMGLLLSCNSTKNATASRTKNTDQSNDSIRLVYPENISVTYQLQIVPPDTIEVSPGKRRLRHSYGDLSCHLTNGNTFPVYYIKWTCDSYPGEMLFNPEKCGWMRNYYCNGSTPAIIELKPGETDHFSLHISKPDNLTSITFEKWYIKFVNKYIELAEIREHLERMNTVVAIPHENATVLIPQKTD